MASLLQMSSSEIWKLLQKALKDSKVSRSWEFVKLNNITGSFGKLSYIDMMDSPLQIW